MNIRECIDSRTKINPEQCVHNITWAKMVKTTRQLTQPRGIGEIPYTLEMSDKNFPSSPKNPNKRHDNKSHKSGSFKTTNPTNCTQQLDNRKKLCETVSHDTKFAHIGPSVREVNGGWNTHSNEVIEKRCRERQQKYIEENQKSKSNSLNSTQETLSTETSDSYKTTVQNSYELMPPDEQIERYRKNALITSILRNTENNYLDIEKNSSISSESILDTSKTSDLNGIQNNMENVHIEEEDEQSMYNFRMGLLTQSKEDEDVYVHPIKELLPKDEVWQKKRLDRKGIETIQSSRNFYMNLDDDNFEFQLNKPNC